MIALWLPALLSTVAILLFISYRIASSSFERDFARTPPRPIEESAPPPAQPPIFLSTIATTRLQKNVALAMVLAILAAFAVVVPYVDRHGPVIPAFPPVGDALLCVIYFIIGFIIIGQFLRVRSWSLLTLAAGFLFQSMMTILHAVSFPGFFLNNTFNMDQQTPVFLYEMWRGGFPLFVIAYAYFHGQTVRLLISRPRLAVVLTILAIIVAPIGAMSFMLHINAALPVAISQSFASNPDIASQYTHVLTNVIGPLILLINLATLLMLWTRGDSVLDVWLMVATCSAIVEVTVSSILGSQRFDVGFYAGRGFGLASAGLVLGALLDEMNRVYASLYRLMQTQRLDSEAKYQAIFDTTVDAIVVIDRNGTIKSFNRAAETMMGYVAAEVLGENVRLLMPEPYHSAHARYLANYHTTGVRKIIGIGREVRGQRKDGKSIAIDLAVTEWHSGDEQLFTGILRDISDRKQMEQQLIQSQKMEAIGQLTGGMAHDFNNILGVVIGNLDMLADHFTEPPEELADALTAATTGADLVQRLLAFARRQPLQPKRIFLSEVVEDMLPLLRRIIGAQVSMEIFTDDNMWPVVADPTQFENVLLNLVINARDAMPHGGKLSIECRSHTMDEDSALEYDVPIGTYTTLIVSDSGVGIPKDVLSRVFEPFFTTKPPGMGSGLGLSMVFGYTRQSGGVIRIYSEVGIGTSVRVYLPSAPNGDREAEDKIEIDTADLHGVERILVVEDTPAARVVAQRILLSLGYTVQIAGDASEALAIIDSGETFDLLFTDIVMPGMNGIDLASIVHGKYPLMQVLFASGFSRTPIEKIEELHATYITKPYRKLELAMLLRNIFTP